MDLMPRAEHGLGAGHATRLDSLEKAWLPRSVIGGACFRHQGMFRSFKMRDEGSQSGEQQHD